MWSLIIHTTLTKYVDVKYLTFLCFLFVAKTERETNNEIVLSFFFLIWIRLEVLHAVSIGLINSQSHKHHRESTNPLFPHFLPLFLFTFQDSLLPHPMYSTWIDAFAAVTYTPPLLSKKWLEKMNIFLWSMILYIYIYIIEMKCNIYYVSYYSICKISTATTIITSCFIVATIFSPLPSPLTWDTTPINT